MLLQSSNKMAQTTWTANLLGLFILSLSAHAVKNDTHVIVRPTNSDPSVCGDNATCNTLDNLITNNASRFNSSNSVFQFLSGSHILLVRDTHHLIVNGLSNTTWYGGE